MITNQIPNNCFLWKNYLSLSLDSIDGSLPGLFPTNVKDGNAGQNRKDVRRKGGKEIGSTDGSGAFVELRVQNC